MERCEVKGLVCLDVCACVRGTLGGGKGGVKVSDVEAADGRYKEEGGSIDANTSLDS